MENLTQLWQATEDAAGRTDVRAAYAEKCGTDFVHIEPFLSPIHEFATRYPCPHPTGYHCPRLIVEDGAGRFDALCQDPHKLCPDLALSAKDVVLQGFDLEGFLKPILQGAGVREQAWEERARVFGASVCPAGEAPKNQPCFLLVFAEATGFQAAVRDLLLEVEGPFLVIAPTNRHRSSALQERLQARGVGFIALEEQILRDDSGRCVSIDPLESADVPQPTPPADRKRVVQQFRTKHKCKVASLEARVLY